MPWSDCDAEGADGARWMEPSTTAPTATTRRMQAAIATQGRIRRFVPSASLRVRAWAGTRRGCVAAPSSLSPLRRRPPGDRLLRAPRLRLVLGRPRPAPRLRPGHSPPPVQARAPAAFRLLRLLLGFGAGRLGLGPRLARFSPSPLLGFGPLRRFGSRGLLGLGPCLCFGLAPRARFGGLERRASASASARARAASASARALTASASARRPLLGFDPRPLFGFGPRLLFGFCPAAPRPFGRREPR